MRVTSESEFACAHSEYVCARLEDLGSSPILLSHASHSLKRLLNGARQTVQHNTLVRLSYGAPWMRLPVVLAQLVCVSYDARLVHQNKNANKPSSRRSQNVNYFVTLCTVSLNVLVAMCVQIARLVTRDKILQTTPAKRIISHNWLIQFKTNSLPMYIFHTLSNKLSRTVKQVEDLTKNCTTKRINLVGFRRSKC